MRHFFLLGLFSRVFADPDASSLLQIMKAHDRFADVGETTEDCVSGKCKPKCKPMACACKTNEDKVTGTDANGCATCSCKPKPCPKMACVCKSNEDKVTGIDGNGCDTCSCKPKPCPKMACNCKSNEDKVTRKDRNGCDTCSCKPKPCPKVSCNCKSNEDKVTGKDRNGCATCSCKRKPCPKVKCNCKAMEQEVSGKDRNGCDTCSCKKIDIANPPPYKGKTCKDFGIRPASGTEDCTGKSVFLWNGRPGQGFDHRKEKNPASKWTEQSYMEFGGDASCVAYVATGGNNCKNFCEKHGMKCVRGIDDAHSEVGGLKAYHKSIGKPQTSCTALKSDNRKGRQPNGGENGCETAKWGTQTCACREK